MDRNLPIRSYSFYKLLNFIHYFTENSKVLNIFDRGRLTEIRRSGSFSFKALWKPAETAVCAGALGGG
jgi:hypothetical protein